jgi:hypothetical protein
MFIFFLKKINFFLKIHTWVFLQILLNSNQYINPSKKKFFFILLKKNEGYFKTSKNRLTCRVGLAHQPVRVN